MRLELTLTNLKNKKLWLKWLLYWFVSALIFGVTFSLTRSPQIGLYSAIHLLTCFSGIGVLIAHPRDTIVPLLAAVTVSMILLAFGQVSGLSTGIAPLQWTKGLAEAFKLGLILGSALWVVGGALLLVGELIKGYLKVEDKIVGPRKK